MATRVTRQLQWVVCFLACSAVLFCRPADAQPVISGYIGEWSDSSRIVVSGSDFGAAPTVISWDDFESGENEQPLSDPIVGPTWTFLTPSPNTPNPYYSSQQAFSGNGSAKVVWREPGWSGYSINAFGWAGKGPFNRIYLTYYRYLDPSEAPQPSNMNHKQVYMYGSADADGHHDCQQWMPFMIPGGQSSWASQLQDLPARLYYWYNAPRYSNTIYNWGRWETYIDYEDGVDDNDGIIKTWYNCDVMRHETGQDLSTVDGGQAVNDIRIGHMFQGYGNLDYVRSYFDDVYIADSQARIEIGDAPVFDSCSWREIQVPESWSTTSVEFNFRTPASYTGGSVYLFIVDDDGNASDGVLIEIGSISDPGPPGAPGQPVAG